MDNLVPPHYSLNVKLQKEGALEQESRAQRPPTTLPGLLESKAYSRSLQLPLLVLPLDDGYVCCTSTCWTHDLSSTTDLPREGGEGTPSCPSFVASFPDRSGLISRPCQVVTESNLSVHNFRPTAGRTSFRTSG